MTTMTATTTDKLENLKIQLEWSCNVDNDDDNDDNDNDLQTWELEVPAGMKLQSSMWACTCLIDQQVEELDELVAVNFNILSSHANWIVFNILCIWLACGKFELTNQN